ncbi:MAG: DUF294 nucleotidyltransferase-like domain-containing protein [Bacteroidales bacterium]
MPKTSLNRFFLSIVMPSILAIGLFILSIFVVILPAFENNIMKGKKEMISELTNTVCSLIDEYHQESLDNLIPVDSARAMAIERVRQIRYGDELKDYFWIIDNQPSMIMHPYRPDLIGQDLNGYEDHDGKLLFVESVRTVNESGEGFIHYMWQWKDDSTRIVPKLSFVMEFQPWHWIVGTGIYLEDVRLEIISLKKRLLTLTLLISLIISAILIFIIRQSLNIERRRGKAEEELMLSREKYKSLVEASTEGTLMWVESTLIFSNLKFSLLSGYDPDEIRRMRLGDLFQMEWESLEKGITDPKKSISRETKLRCKDGSTLEVVISASKISHAGQDGYIMVIKEVSDLMKYEKESEHLATELQASLLMMSRPLHSISREVRQCPSTTTIREAAMIMARKKQEILLIHHVDQLIGIISNSDLVKRALSVGMDPGESVLRIMSAPVISLSQDALLYEGLLMMTRHGVSHLAVSGRNQKIIGIVGYREITEMQQNMVDFLISDIERSEEVEQIRGIYKRLPVLVKALVESGSNTENMTHLITSVADAIHRRLIFLSIDELGSPPCKFAFMVMGSQGRGEQTLATDQDNAIIIEDLPNDKLAEAKNYFQLLGKKVNTDLNAVGYRFCPGEIMAGNPKWNQNLETWKEYFSEWLRKSNPADILDAAIFFDFRYIHGEISLVQELRDHVNQASENKSVFYFHMAQSVLKMKPQVIGSNTNKLDLKKILLPVTTFIRLYSIREKLLETSSIKRAEILLDHRVLDQSTFDELSHSFNYLTNLRIKGQVNSIAHNEIPDNIVDMKRLNRIEAVVLKKLLSDISGLQTRLSGEFSVI